MSFFCCAVIPPFSGGRSANFDNDFSIPANPLSKYFCSTSSTVVSNPAIAATCAMPDPINPQPKTPTFLISIPSSFHRLGPELTRIPNLFHHGDTEALRTSVTILSSRPRPAKRDERGTLRQAGIVNAVNGIVNNFRHCNSPSNPDVSPC